MANKFHPTVKIGSLTSIEVSSRGPLTPLLEKDLLLMTLLRLSTLGKWTYRNWKVRLFKFWYSIIFVTV